MSEAEAKIYLGAINASMSSPNMILDLRIPQNQKYQQVVLDEAISRFLAGEIDADATVEAVTERLERAERRDRHATSSSRSTRRRSAPSSADARSVRRGSTAPDFPPGRLSGARPHDRCRRDRLDAARARAGRAARPPRRPPHGAAGGHRPPLLRDLPADHLGLSGAVALRARAGRLHAQVRRPRSTSRSC